MNAQTDMSPVIIPKSDQINSDDLLAGPITVTIREVKITPGTEQPVSIFIEGSEKAFRPCKSMSRVLVQAWGADAKAYIGRSVTLYCDPTVKWGGLEVGGIRISHLSDIDGPRQMMLTATKGSRKPFKILPLKVEVQPADDLAVALNAITAAAEDGTEALAIAWKQKWMAPHREALQLDLDRLKVIAAAKDAPATEPEQPADADPNVNDTADEAPAAQAKAGEIVAALDSAKSAAALEKIIAEAEQHRPAMDDELLIRLDIAVSKNRQRFEQAEAQV